MSAVRIYCTILMFRETPYMRPAAADLECKSSLYFPIQMKDVKMIKSNSQGELDVEGVIDAGNAIIAEMHDLIADSRMLRQESERIRLSSKQLREGRERMFDRQFGI